MIAAAVGVGLLLIGLALLGVERRVGPSDQQAEVLGVLAAVCLFFAIGFILRALGVATPLDQMLYPPPPPL